MFAPPRTDAERRDWLALTRTERVGPRAFARLATRYATPAEALAALPSLSPPGAAGYRTPDPAAVAAELSAGAACGARLLCLGAPDYPAALAEIEDPPPALWAVGDVALAARPCVAVIGARNASALGLRLAEMMARDLGAAGWTVVSGLARGIDAAAHKATLETGAVAVFAGGVDVVYPEQNAAIAAAIAEQGLILSEAPMGEAPQARHFPRRNRIVSGLSRGVVLVEAADRSGSLITARLAGEQGREVMAAPGSPLDPRAAGCNALLREGATLVRSAEDVIEALTAGLAPSAPRPPKRVARAPAPTVAVAAPPLASADAAGRVLDLLGAAPVGFDDLARAAALSPAALSALLLDLELEGRIDRRPGDLIARA